MGSLKAKFTGKNISTKFLTMYSLWKEYFNVIVAILKLLKYTSWYNWKEKLPTTKINAPKRWPFLVLNLKKNLLLIYHSLRTRDQQQLRRGLLLLVLGLIDWECDVSSCFCFLDADVKLTSFVVWRQTPPSRIVAWSTLGNKLLSGIRPNTVSFESVNCILTHFLGGDGVVTLLNGF